MRNWAFVNVFLISTTIHFGLTFLFILLSQDFQWMDIFYFPGRWIVSTFLDDESFWLIRPFMLPLTSVFWGCVIAIIFLFVKTLWHHANPQK